MKTSTKSATRSNGSSETEIYTDVMAWTLRSYHRFITEAYSDEPNGNKLRNTSNKNMPYKDAIEIDLQLTKKISADLDQLNKKWRGINRATSSKR